MRWRAPSRAAIKYRSEANARPVRCPSPGSPTKGNRRFGVLRVDAKYLPCLYHRHQRPDTPAGLQGFHAEALPRARVVRGGHLPASFGISQRCRAHGWFESLINSDADSYVSSLKYNKPGTIPLEFSTEVNEGCPLDCGLCPEHKQHACLALIEVNTRCNLACPICFADAGPGYNLTMEQVESMLDLFIRTEGDPEVVQFSGGEPTIHPLLFDMIRMAQDKGIRYTMVNTNGRRIAQDESWARQLAELRPVIYLQFDGLEDETYVKLRGEPLLKEKLAALDRLAEFDMNVILVATVERGVNEHEVGPLIKFGLEHPAVRGLNFQPVTHTGRHAPFDPMDRVTIPEVIGRIEDQTEGLFVKSDFVPVPCCHPGCQSITNAFVDHGEVTPLPRIVNVDEYLDYVTNRALLPDLSYDIQRSLEAL